MVASATAADRLKSLPFRLHVASVVDRTTHDLRRLPVPSPQQTKTRVRLRQHRPLQLSACPGPALIRADLYALNTAAPTPCESADLDPSGLHHVGVRRGRDH